MNAPFYDRPFYITFWRGCKKGDVIKTDSGDLFRILKTYPNNWWKKLKKWLRIPTRPDDIYKVKYIGNTPCKTKRT